MSWLQSHFNNINGTLRQIRKSLLYVRTHMKINYSIPLAYTGSMLYAIPSLLDIYTIDAHSIHFQFCSLIAFPSLLEQCYILMQYLLVIYSSNLVLLLVSFNVYVTPSFFQLCSLSVFFLFVFLYVLYFSIQVWLLSHTLVLKFITLTSSTSSYYLFIF